MNGFLISGILLITAMAYCLGYRCGHETTLADRRELWRLRHQAGVYECTIECLEKELRKKVIEDEYAASTKAS